MLELYRVKDCPACDDIEEHLKDLVLAHRVIDIEQAETLPQVVERLNVPVLKEGERIYGTTRVIQAYLASLADELEQGREFQSDACYIDPEHGECI